MKTLGRFRQIKMGEKNMHMRRCSTRVISVINVHGGRKHKGSFTPEEPRWGENLHTDAAPIATTTGGGSPRGKNRPLS